MSVLLGPILSFRGIFNGSYNVSLLVVTNIGDPAPAGYFSIGKVTEALRVGQIPFYSPVRDVWRIDVEIKIKSDPEGLKCSYQIEGESGEFYVPVENNSPRMAYGSCNGFSAERYRRKVSDRQNERWFDMAASHELKPFHLLVLGGDQIYSDELMVKDGPLLDWSERSSYDRINCEWGAEMEAQADGFYAALYVTRWAQSGPREMLRSIPSIMMWDDHDIMDGWGSYPEAVHECSVYKNLFRIASKYFCLFQLQLADGERHPAAVPSAPAYSLAFKGLGRTAILIPDLRTERQPDLHVDGKFSPTRIASEGTWTAIFNWLENIDTAWHKHLLVFSSVPVAYIDLNVAEKTLNSLPGQWELEDDLRDHWRSKPHRDERQRLIKRLLNFASRGTRVTLVSGDVHVAAACVIESRLPQHVTRGAGVIFQLISTGIVHTPPPAMAVWFMEKLAANPEIIEHGITSTMLPIGYQGHFLVPERNWLSLEPDEKYRIWANWHVEGHPHLLTQVIDAIPEV